MAAGADQAIRLSFNSSVPYYTPTLDNASLGWAGAGGGLQDEHHCNTNDTDGYKHFYETAQMVTGLIIYPILCVTGITGKLL